MFNCLIEKLLVSYGFKMVSYSRDFFRFILRLVI